ncbi:MAG TPA: alpha/beta hydrolase [Candidatus Binataceae bacterium]|nr:alpha/beta hydrolase [Candidatus Binataceae bacterium]
MLYEFLPTPGHWMTRPATLIESTSKIMMIPGFMAGDASLYPLATGLRGMGHRVFFAGIWSNVDCPRQTMERLARALENAFYSDGRKLVLLGHSLGGIYARELARRLPEMVERTILLASAIREPLDNSNPFVRMWFMATRRSHHEGGSCHDHLRSLCGAHRPEPASREIAQTIIYSRNDAVVDWRSCIETGPNIEAIEVRAGHNSMPFSPEVFAIVAERARRNGGEKRIGVGH